MTTERQNERSHGDHVELDGQNYIFAALNGDGAELRSAHEAPVSILLAKLLDEESFRILFRGGNRRYRRAESKAFQSLPELAKN